MVPFSKQLTVGPSTELRQLVASDASALFAMVDANRAYLRQWLPWLDRNTTEQHTRAFIHNIAVCRRDGQSDVWGVIEDGDLCGVCGFNWIEPVNRIAEIGYWMAEQCRGRGIMTRCVGRLIQHAFEDLNLNRITIPTAVNNTRSRAIPMRLGFREEGVLKQAEWLYDHWVDHVQHALVRDDWHPPLVPSPGTAGRTLG